MKIYVVCEEFFDWSDPVVAYTREEDAEEYLNTLRHPNGTCSGEVFEIELITDNAQVDAPSGARSAE